MNYSKLKLSFLLLLAMCIVQFLVAFFILHNTLISILSVICFALCIWGLGYISKKTK
ncbi:MAG: hypothetical protein AB9856_17240 [Cellulosilyticaceae bacterium]